MNIIVSSVNYKTTPLEIREILSFEADEQKKVLFEINKLPHVEECVLLCTCNRTEVYIYSNISNFDYSLIEKILCDVKGIKLYNLKKYFYTFTGSKAVRHLYQVASGLDSMVLGEDQILGQVKSAYHLSLETGTGSSVLNSLFLDAITVAKKIKTVTQLSKNSVSIGTLALKLLSDIFGKKLNQKSVLVIGTGKMGSIVLKNLYSKGFRKIYITNRSHCKTIDLISIFPGTEIIEYDKRYSVINECDIVISSTSSPHYVITKDILEKFVHQSKERVFIDLAVPRDIDEAITDITGVRYINIDHLHFVVDENLDKRIVEASKAELIIDSHIEDFEKWYAFRSVLPIVKDLQKYAETLVKEKVEATLNKLQTASEDDKNTVKCAIATTVNGIMNKFIYSVRENASKEDIRNYFNCLKDIV